MAIVKMKPTSAGRRGMVRVVAEGLHKGAPYAPLVEKKNTTAGRNNNGHITTRHKGGGHKQHYRVVDFKRNKDGIPAKVERIEYDPNRTAFIALLCYADGERRYIIAPRGIQAGAVLVSGAEAAIKAGNALPIRNIPVGTTIHCIEMKPGKGAQIARSAGASAVHQSADRQSAGNCTGSRTTFQSGYGAETTANERVNPYKAISAEYRNGRSKHRRNDDGCIPDRIHKPECSSCKYNGIRNLMHEPSGAWI